ncbi:unnamed protein product [Linum tenue]|uniref:Uncharacterized protein n=1 Tax=Linum tenue TaxID=586396 RepID=A0AAV0PEN6_9ROSI|nr:unnamed protein product [Linum tenue]
MTQEEVRRLRLAQTAFAMNQQMLRPPMTMQLPSGGGTSLISGMPAAAGQMPIRTGYPLEYGRMFNEHRQFNNSMRPPVGNMLSYHPQSADIQPQLNLPTLQATAAAPSSASQSNLQKGPVQNPILRQPIANNGQGIKTGSSSNMVDNGSNGEASFGRGGPEFVASSDEGTIPMPPEGWLMNFLMDAQKFQPGFLSDKGQQGQQKSPGQRPPLAVAEGTIATRPGNSADTNIRDSKDSNLEGNETMTEKNGEAEKPDQDDEIMQQATEMEDTWEPDVKRPEYHFIQSFLFADGDENGDEESIRLIEGHDEAQYPQATYQAIQSVNRLNMSKNKMLCCHFSSNGKLLVTSGHEKKVWIWNTENYRYTRNSGGHSNLVTDIRFQPSTTVFATSSFDKTVQIWDAEKPSRSLFKLKGHSEQVLSLDFHPRQIDRLCSSDRNGEIRLWNVNQDCLLKVSKGATAQVRFQPQSGKLLALASGNTVSVVDSETYAVQLTLKDHVNDVRSICWDSTGKYIASVSEESARIWSLAAGGKCIHKLMSHGRNFHSCTFHPHLSQALLVGGYKNLVFWSANQKCSTEAHKGIIAAMASSPAAGLIASASHDGFVKLWR